MSERACGGGREGGTDLAAKTLRSCETLAAASEHETLSGVDRGLDDGWREGVYDARGYETLGRL